MEALISIIVPVHNAENYLTRCIDSILNQTHKNLEIILVNDGSTDQSGKLCDDYAKRDGRIVVKHKKNGGASTARNCGLDLATGDYVGFVDCDDYIAPDMFEVLLINTIKYNADISKVLHFAVNDGAVKEPKNSNGDVIIMSSYEQFIKGLWLDKTIGFALWGKLFKRELWANVRMEDGFIHQDMMVSCLLFKRCKRLAVIHEPLYFYVQTPFSASRKNVTRGSVDSYLYATKYFADFMTNNSPQYLKYVLPNNFRMLMLGYIKLRFIKDMNNEEKKEYKSLLLQRYADYYSAYTKSDIYIDLKIVDRIGYKLFLCTPKIFSDILLIISKKVKKLTYI